MPKNVVHRLEVSSKEVLVSVSCNQCGEKKLADSGRFPAGMISFELEGGFEDNFPADMQKFTFYLCESCLKKICLGFSIPMDVSYRTPGSSPRILARLEFTDEMYFVEGFYAWKTSDPEPQTYGFDEENFEEFPPNGVYRSKHSLLPWEVIGWAGTFSGADSFVVARALYGSSDTVLVRLKDWAAEFEPFLSDRNAP